MLSERIQRMMMGTILVAVLFLFNYQETMIASILLIGMIGLIYVWAIFDFCPSLWFLGKVFKEDSKIS
ncbi:phosphoribosylaminoimidazole synthetase [Sulfurimonas sp. MAG313]|nr:phosphoribosylaminoimidazole synthetase [Sulfurimonas sp. MAG313]MDF1882014.1 phosphoribosylaminoimidazole synthetase [Sulfurimonas sp. MAG313]